MKLNLIHFTALAAVAWLGMSSSSRSDFTFQIGSQDDGSVVTFLAEGASDVADYSLNPGNLVVESITNGTGLNQSFGTLTIQLKPVIPSLSATYISVLPNASGTPVIPDGGTYLFDDAVISSSVIAPYLANPTYNILAVVQVNDTWTRNLSAPEPLSILGAVVALGFGIALKQYKRRLAA